VPYTLTRLNDFLWSTESQQELRKYYNRSLLCKSLLGNRIEKITITDPSNPDSEKKGLVVMGRVHPGETVSSYMVEGLIRWLLSEDDAASSIRKHFIVKIIPMLNPDGVIHGNSRYDYHSRFLGVRWQDVT
jgi:murein tripeptide amidase MpaA